MALVYTSLLRLIINGLLRMAYFWFFSNFTKTAHKYKYSTLRIRYLYPRQPRPWRLYWMHGREPLPPHPLGRNDYSNFHPHPRSRIA